MTLPTPDDPARAPVWENYVLAQTVQASLGIIPISALAVGVDVDGYSVRVHFQLSALTSRDVEDMDDIISYLEAFLGSKVAIRMTYERREERDITPRDGMCWIFLSRIELED